MRTNRRIIYLAGFLFSIPIALTSYINSSFLERFTSSYYVGMVYVVASLITILTMLEMPRFLTRWGNRKMIMGSSIILFASLILLAIGGSKALIITSFILYFISSNFIVASLDIFMEDFSKANSIGTSRGFYLMILSSAWVLAQSISGSVIEKSSFAGIYLLSGLFMVLFYSIFILFLKDFRDPLYKKMPVLRTFKFFIRSKDISRIYFLNFLLKFFYAWMIIYTPVYLHEYMGFAWDKIGIIFTFMLLPFVILEFPLGKLSDKIGEKKMLFFGFVASGLATLIIPIMKEPKLIAWAAILFFTRVGASFIEVMSESYFFKSIKEDNADAVSFFRNTGPLSFIIGPLTATGLLLILPSFKFLFFILGALMLYGAFLSLRLREVK